MTVTQRGHALTTMVLFATTLCLTALPPPLSSGGSVAGLGPVATSTRSPPLLPDRIDLSGKVRQLITVSAVGWGSRTAQLKAWQRAASGRWELRRGPVPVVIGYNGWVKAAERRQSTGTTPAGKFRLPFAFGRLADPGTPIEYRRFDANDWWPYEPRDPATYNVYQYHKASATRWRADYSEHLADYAAQYAYALVVGFNMPSGIRYSAARRQLVASRPADTSRGGGIFLHVRGDGFTAGCVAMSRDQMRWLLRWVRPGAHPRIAMGPHGYITRL